MSRVGLRGPVGMQPMSEWLGREFYADRNKAPTWLARVVRRACGRGQHEGGLSVPTV